MYILFLLPIILFGSGCAPLERNPATTAGISVLLIKSPSNDHVCFAFYGPSGNLVDANCALKGSSDE